VVADDRELFAVNMLVVGVAPDRANWLTASPALRVRTDDRVAHDGPATAVVVASGQYLRGSDLVPRGHPGDGRAEVQVYAVRRGQRAGVRARLPQGVHLPHPDIAQTSGRHVEIRADRGPVPLEVDGVPAPPAAHVTVEVVPGAFVLVV
jgi:diacylglycerol kinase family enzyme